MKAFLVTTGVLFGALTVVHVWRAIVERSVLHEPFFIAVTVAGAILCVWAFGLLRAMSRR